MTKGALLQLATQEGQGMAIEQIPVNFSGDVSFGKRVSAEIPLKADLLSNIYLNITLPKLTSPDGEFAGWTNSVGNAIIEYCELRIGEQLIDRIPGTLLEILDELDDDVIENQKIGKYDTNLVLDSSALTEREFFIPLRFWFFDNLKDSIPLVSLQNTAVRIFIKFRDFSEIISYDGINPPEEVVLYARLLCDFCFLDNQERRRIFNSNHSIPIIQHQINSTTSIDRKNTVVNLEFNRPVLEMFWVFREIESEENNDWFNFSKRVPNGDLVTGLMEKCKFLINGIERFEGNELYFRTISNKHASTNKHLYQFSFESGSNSLNFSMIDDASIHISAIDNVPNSNLYVYARSENTLEIKDGQGGLKFVN